jgi:orotate phosphoribosyltransferase
MENEREQLRRLLKAESLIFGDFTLASGKKSTFYFDSKRTTLRSDGAG